MLVGLLLLLVAIRFIFVPWLDYQGELIAKLDADSGRLERYYSVLDTAEQLDINLALLQEAYTSMTSELITEKTHSTVSLLVQNQWFPLLEKNNVILDFFNWQGQTAAAQPEIYNASVIIKVSGAFLDIVRLQTDLENMDKTLRFTSIEYQWRGDMGVVANIKVEFLYQVQIT